MEVVAATTVTTQPLLRKRSPFEAKLVSDHSINIDKLHAAMSILPQNYSFEVDKTICRILDLRKQGTRVQKVSLQFPEGLLTYSTLIADILATFTGVDCLILGDVTYGACCVDDLASKALACDFVVHYGHSCLVPIQELSLKHALYVFVEIDIDVEHLVASVALSFKGQPLTLLGTIQFNKALFVAKAMLEKLHGFTDVQIPQTKPRSGGEVLGCTSPALGEGVAVFVSDGRFHIESAMIKNPQLRFFQYNPYSLKLTSEVYEHQAMHEIRFKEIERARAAKRFGIVFGTLGRQGSQTLLKEIEALLRQHSKPYFVLFLSEISPAKLNRFANVEAWVQIACPRLSVDWGHCGFKAPLLNTYEAFVCLGEAAWLQGGVYPMDYYSYEGGRWSNYFRENEERKQRLASKPKKPVKIEYE